MTKYKKGDVLRCLPGPFNENLPENGSGGHGYASGRIFTIQKIETYESYIIYWPAHDDSPYNNGGIYDYAITKAKVTNWQKHMEGKK